jgi:pimeloyl-ACP methyl ester carboxylesterase
VPLPDFVLGAFPKVQVPTLVIWGMLDGALLPIQLEGLDRLVEDLRIVRIPDAGHFAPWERPEPVAEALRGFLAYAG